MYDMAWTLLQPAINLGLEEAKFWDMTKAEIERYINGAVWRYKTQAQMDYTLADLIGISSARMMSSDVNMPSIVEAYPTLFEEEALEERKQQERTNKSVNNFLAAAAKINAAKKKDGGEQN